jgi:excisionase family DNA binding protein
VPDLASSGDQGWLSIGEVAHLLGLHANTLRRWDEKEQIFYTVTPGGHRRFANDDVASLLEKQRLLRRPGDIWPISTMPSTTTICLRISHHRTPAALRESVISGSAALSWESYSASSSPAQTTS